MLAWLVLSPAAARAQDSIAEAKRLYQTADYDAALGMLDRLKNDAVASADPELAPYRVLCLLALGRSDDAQQSIATLLRENPRYRPSEADTAPRIRAVFDDARRRLLPQILRDRYDAAKAAFERKEFQAAAEQFESLLPLFDDPAISGSELRVDLRMVVSGFSDLARAADKAQKPAPVPAAPPAATPIALDAAAPPERVYVGGAGVIPPAPISKPLPQIPRSLATMWRDQVAILDVLVNEDGNVGEVTIKKSVHAQFDKQIVEAVRAWKFRPATRDGQPVSFRQIVEVKLAP